MVAGPGDSPGPPDEWDGPSALPQYTETVPFKQVGRADTKKCFVNPDSVNTIKDPMEKRIEMLLRAKLLEWDKDQSGTFNFEQVKDAMAEIRDVANHIGTLRQYIAFAGLLLVALVPVFIGVGYVALTASKEVYVGHSGSLEALRPGFDDREVVVTTQEYNFQNVQNMLDFDLVTNEWVVSNFALREMDSVSFELVNGSYYHFDVVEVTREDSGQDGESDKLEVTTTNGAKLRLWESLESLEAKWAGSSMWELLDVRDEDAYADPNGQLHEVAEPPEQGPASFVPQGGSSQKAQGEAALVSVAPGQTASAPMPALAFIRASWLGACTTTAPIMGQAPGSAIRTSATWTASAEEQRVHVHVAFRDVGDHLQHCHEPRWISRWVAEGYPKTVRGIAPAHAVAARLAFHSSEFM
eukprot:CAMPEP_0117515168 /NCGR_PEP_ID=MMETSP0784-20121206/30441_1 /TAXON_ID=39447 /ORGANISM="" /LENGTH=410 /DNA_ID=CAMNT_0005310977 /DNA_START=67 /DNA_END=1301 /DNA_ORIENTATION=+